MPFECAVTAGYAAYSNKCTVALCSMGMDILGSFSVVFVQQKFLLMTIDYFTKWIEAKPFAKITEAKMKDFIWKSIVCCFGLPRIIITDNGRKFSGFKLAKFC